MICDFLLEPLDFAAQVRDDVGVLSDVVRHIYQVLLHLVCKYQVLLHQVKQLCRRQVRIHRAPSAYPRSDALGTVGVSQRVPRLLEGNGSGTDVRDHDRSAVAAQRVLSTSPTSQVLRIRRFCLG